MTRMTETPDTTYPGAVELPVGRNRSAGQQPTEVGVGVFLQALDRTLWDNAYKQP